MTWADRRVLITGHIGFVGSNLVRTLLDVSAKPFGVDRARSSPSLRVLNAECPGIVADVTSLTDMIQILDEIRPDVVYHLAGQGHIKDAQEVPWLAFYVNVLGTVAVLEAVRRARPTTVIVCASSNHAYVGGPQPRRPFLLKAQREDGTSGWGEDNILNGTDVYGASKSMGDRAVACYRHSLGLRAAAVRHVNAYGPGDPHASHLVTASILSCLRGEPPQLRGQGTAVKGYLHVADVVAAYLRIAERVDELHGHAVNVTDPEAEASVLQVMTAVCAAAGLDARRIVSLPGSVSDQEGYEERLDDSQIRALGWRPTFTLHTGIADTVAWYQAHGGMSWLVK